MTNISLLRTWLKAKWIYWDHSSRYLIGDYSATQIRKSSHLNHLYYFQGVGQSNTNGKLLFPTLATPNLATAET